MAIAEPLLVDTMIVIEAVRTGCWRAISGQRAVVTVTECSEELLRGDAIEPGYVTVSPDDIVRMTIESVTPIEAAGFRLRYADADGLDRGERDLLTHAAGRTDEFQICSSDKAAVRAAHALGLLDRVVSLETVADTVGARPNPPLRVQFTEKFLGEWRTKLHLGVRL